MILVLIAPAVLHAETAVLPYRVANPSDSLPDEKGVEYAKLLSLAAHISKRDLVITPPGLVEGDLNGLGIDASDTITSDDLVRLGRRGRIDYILLGTLSRTKGTYRSESVIFGVGERKIIARIKVSGSSLFKLANAEIREAFVQYGDRKRTGGGSSLDIAFVVDMSYAMSADWSAVKRGIYGLSSLAVDTLGIDSKIYFIPYSEKITSQMSFASHNSLLGVKKNLRNMTPTGPSSGSAFDRSMTYAVKNIPWRQSAKKMIFMIAASDLKGSRTAEQEGIRAGKMGVIIHSLSLGRSGGGNDSLLQSIADAAGGMSINAVYHQQVFDKDGVPVELYMEGGRLFRSEVYDGVWKDGVTERKGGGRYRKVREGFEEIHLEQRGAPADPHGIPDLFSRVTLTPVLNAGKLMNNIDRAMEKAAGRSLRTGRGDPVPLGKVLISDGGMTFWTSVRDPREMKFFLEKKGQPFPFHLGVAVRKEPGEIYGISLIPEAFGVTSDFIPDMIKTSVGDIIKRKQYYMNEGLFFPPVWFIDAKVEEVVNTGGKGDVRSQ